MRLYKAMTAALLIAAFCSSRADAGIIWADVTTANTTTFSGTINGVPFNGDFSNFPFATNTAGTSTVFSGPSGTFTPLLPTSDVVGFFSQSGFTLTFDQPVVNPVFHILSLANTLDFGTPVTLVSAGPINAGGTGITVSGNTVIGVSDVNGFDSNGTISLSGSFTKITAISNTGNVDGAGFIFGANSAVTVVPEPVSLAVFGLIAAGGVIGYRRQKAGTLPTVG